MKKSPDKEVIPDHEAGVQTDTESSLECGSVAEAKAFYAVVKQRLLSVNSWQKLAGPATAGFCLTDEKGASVSRTAQKGDYFKIDLPAPGTKAGEGHDWVQIEQIDEEDSNDRQVTAIRVRPASSPLNNKEAIAHFFSEDATSSFMVRREGSLVTASVHGRNEKPNVHTDSIADNIRNAAVATSAITGLSKIQWKSLVNGLIAKE